MKFVMRLSHWAAALACVGMLLPQSALATTPQLPNQGMPPIYDAKLGRGGTLTGQVVNKQNVPVAGTPVVVFHQGKAVRNTTTDADGRYAVDGLRGGLYVLRTDKGFTIYRAWSPETAPPAAQASTMIVNGDEVLRAQGRAWYWLTNPWLISAGIAAAIIIPIAVNNDSKTSS